MKKYSTIPTLSILALAIMLYGCNKGQEGPVLAKVNRGAITVSDFKKQIEELAPQMQQAVMADPKARKELLDDMIGIELVIQEAKRQGLDKDPEYKKRQDQLKKELEHRIQEEAKNDLFNSLLKKELGDKMNKVTPPSDEEMQAYFDQNKEKIFQAAGKKVSLKDIAPQLKMRLTQEKRREVYVEYSKGLKAKAKISVDDKALDTAMTDLTKHTEPSGLAAPKGPAAGKEEPKK